VLRSEHLDDQIAQVTLARPHAKNALSFALLDELATVFDTLSNDASVHVILLAHEGNVFCAGGDLAELEHKMATEDGEALHEAGVRALSAIRNAPKPVIAVLSGPAIGGGAELALACDFRIMSEAASLEFRHVRLGATTAWGSAPLLVRALGTARASDILMRGRVLSALACVSLGLAELAESATEAARVLAIELSRLPHGAMAATKQNVQIASSAQERENFVRTWSSDEHKRAVTAAIRARKSAKVEV
jgi:enoyl-CoA hydratase